MSLCSLVFFFQAEDGIRDVAVTGVQTCALPISGRHLRCLRRGGRWSLMRRVGRGLLAHGPLHGVPHKPRQREHGEGAHEGDAEGDDGPGGAQRHQRASNSLCTRETNATFSNSGRNALSHALSTTRARSALVRPNTLWATKYSSV